MKLLHLLFPLSVLVFLVHVSPCVASKEAAPVVDGVVATSDGQANNDPQKLGDDPLSDTDKVKVSVDVNAEDDTATLVVTSNDGEHSAVVMTRRLRNPHRRKQEPFKAMMILLILFIMLLGGQVVLVNWKKHSPKSFTRVTLVGLWIFPCLYSLYHQFWRFIVFWVAHSSFIAWITKLATTKPLDPKSPQLIYKWLEIMYKACNYCGCMGYAVIVIEIFGLGKLLFFTPQTLIPVALMFLMYGLYFGVVTRDFAEVAADRLCNTIGYVKYETPPVNLCALCGEQLKPTLIQMKNLKEEDIPNTTTLNCGHEFHERCVRGWAIVGKKDTCPFCTEKVDLRQFYGTSPWQKQSLFWAQILDSVRYMIVWNPVIFIAMRVVLVVLGLAPLHPTMDASPPPTMAAIHG